MLEVDQFMPTFVPGAMGGGETYARNIYEALRTTEGVSVRAIVPENVRELSPDGETEQIRGISLTPSIYGRLSGFFNTRLRTASVEKLVRPTAVKFIPFTAPILSPSRLRPLVLTLHDVQHLELPHLFSSAEKLYRKVLYERPARKANHIITISEHAKASIESKLGIHPSRITAIHHGVDTSDFSPNFGEREQFVYYPARGWPHKNHHRLIEAMSIVRRVHPELRLVLTGGDLELLDDLPEWIENRGLVSFDEVRALYRRASVLAFPSLFEGFGLPPLEAMASATPVAVSNVASLPEICGDAAVYFDPTDAENIAQGIITAIQERDRLVPLGLEQVKKFTWQAAAAKHLDVFEAVSASFR